MTCGDLPRSVICSPDRDRPQIICLVPWFLLGVSPRLPLPGGRSWWPCYGLGRDTRVHAMWKWEQAVMIPAAAHRWEKQQPHALRTWMTVGTLLWRFLVWKLLLLIPKPVLLSLCSVTNPYNPLLGYLKSSFLQNRSLRPPENLQSEYSRTGIRTA